MERSGMTALRRRADLPPSFLWVVGVRSKRINEGA
jgi:hypothetical protein